MRRGRLAEAALAAWLGTASLAHAVTIPVDSTADDLNLGANGNCTLREAIQAANTDTAVDGCIAGAGADTVLIPVGTYTLTIPGANEDENATGDLDFTSDVTLEGAGSGGAILDGGAAGGVPLDRVIHVRAAAIVELRDLTVRHGALPPSDDLGSDAIHSGGGIRIEDGDVGLDRCVVQANACANGYYVPGMRGLGGGVALQTGTLRITDSTFEGNECNRGGGLRVDGGEARLLRTVVSDNTGIFEGGGVSVASGASLSLDASAVVRNTALRAWCFGYSCAWVYAQGGGIANHGQATILNSTVADNLAYPAPVRQAVGAALFDDGVSTIVDSTLVGGTGSSVDTIVSDASAGGVTRVRSSIVAPGCAGGGVVSDGFNLEASTGCGFTAPTDLAGIDPGLMPLTLDPSGTWVVPLQPWSPVIDSGDDGTCPVGDQRGSPRPIDGDGDGEARCDRGAYETEFHQNGGCVLDPEPTAAPTSLAALGITFTLVRGRRKASRWMLRRPTA